MSTSQLLDINLLPWREQLRQERKRQFIILLACSAVIAVVCVLMVHMMIAGRISSQQARNQYLQSEIKQLDKKIEQIKALRKQRENLIARMDIIQELQKSRFLVVRFFDEIVTKTSAEFD